MKKILSLFFVSLLLSFNLASAQDQKNLPVKIVIPQAANSGLATIYSHLEKFANKKNISMIPVFKPGANGAIGINYAAKENNVLLLSTITDYVSAAGENSFKPIGAINEIELVLVASKKSNIKTVNDIVNIEKSNPGKLNWAQFSSAAGEFINKFSKVHGLDNGKMHRILYKEPRVSDVVNGDIDVAFVLARQAASLSDSQHITLVEVDNFTKLKLAEKKNATGLFAPAGLDSSTIKLWSALLNEFLLEDAVREFFLKANSRTFDRSSPEHLTEIISNWKEQ